MSLRRTIRNIRLVYQLSSDTTSWRYVRHLVLASILFEVCSIGVMSIISRFYLAVSSQDGKLFLTTLWQALLVITFLALLKSYKDFAADKTALAWRTTLVTSTHLRYFTDSAALILQEQKLDTVDQRITQDIDLLTSESSKLLSSLVALPLMIVFYSVYLFMYFGVVAPAACFVYFVIGTLASATQARLLVPLTYEKETLEGCFRSEHSFILSHLESIYLSRGFSFHLRRATDALHALIGKTSEIIRKRLHLHLIVNWFSYLGSIVNYAVIGLALLVISSNEELSSSQIASLMAKGTYACIYLIGAFTSLLEASDKASLVVGLVYRVADLLEALDNTCNNKPVLHLHNSIKRSESSLKYDWSVHSSGVNASCGEIQLTGQSTTISLLQPANLCITNLTLPHTRIRNLNCTISPGMRLLVTGASGVGKTSLLRSIAAAWIDKQQFEGSIAIRCDHLLMVPQNILCVQGSLLDNICYPNEAPLDTTLVSRIQSIAARVGLSMHTDGPTSSPETEVPLQLESDPSTPLLPSSGSYTPVSLWSEVASQGERQRMCFARILFHQPSMVLLDEASSGLDSANEALCFAALRDVVKTTVCVGHGSRLRRYHSHELRVELDGSYSMKRIE